MTSPSVRRRWDRWKPFLTHCGIAVPVFVAAWLEVGAGPLLIGGGLLAAVGYPIVTLREMRLSGRHRLNPLTFLFGWHSLSLGLAGLWKGWSVVSGATAFQFSVTSVSADDLATGYTLYLLGLLVFHAGVTVLRPSGDDISGPKRPLPQASYGLLWSVGVTSRLFRSALSWLGGIHGILAAASNAALCALALRRIAGRRAPTKWWLVLAVGVAIECALGVLADSKGAAMFAFLPVLWMALRSRRPIVNVSIVLGTLALLYGAIVYPVVTAARNAAALDRTTGWYSFDDLSRAGRGKEASDPSAVVDALFDRVFEPTPVGFLVSEVRRSGMRGGATMAYIPSALVPRVLWPDKPIVVQGHVFDSFVSAADTSMTSLAQTSPGELFWNFGVPGVVAGMLMLGILFGWLWSLAGNARVEEPLRMLLYVDLIAGAPGVMEIEFGSSLVALLYRALVFGALLHLPRRPRRARAGARVVTPTCFPVA